MRELVYYRLNSIPPVEKHIIKRNASRMPAKKEKKKLFVLDTNVLLHDHTCIYNFEEHDIVIPIVVLEELDKFKKGSGSINFESREFIRELDRITENKSPNRGISLGKGRGKLYLDVVNDSMSSLEHVFTQNKPDHRIIALAVHLKEKKRNRQVIVVSKDINLRMKARSLGVPAEDYETGKIRNVEELYSGVNTYTGCSKEYIDRLYQEPFSIPVDEFPFREEPVNNQYFVLKNGSASAMAYNNSMTKSLEKVNKKSVFGISPRNAEQIFAVDALTRPDIELVALTGKAGTGKTLLALAAALHQRKYYRQVYLARPIVPLGNHDMGFLPGDIQSKLDPYMEPLWDNLSVIKDAYSSKSHTDTIDRMLETGKLSIAPLAYIRGRSLGNVFFIVDEAQNLTPHEVKTIITRAASGTKLAFTGDIYQIDTPYLDSQSNGLTFLVDRMKGQKPFASINLLKGERSALAELASDLL